MLFLKKLLGVIPTGKFSENCSSIFSLRDDWKIYGAWNSFTLTDGYDNLSIVAEKNKWAMKKNKIWKSALW